MTQPQGESLIMSKSKFVEFLGSSHVRYLNAALYESGAVRIEHVVNGKCLAVKKFESVEAAKNWFDAFEGRNTDRLVAAMKNMGVAA